MTAPFEVKIGADSVSGLVRVDPGTDPRQDSPEANPEEPPPLPVKGLEEEEVDPDEEVE